MRALLALFSGVCLLGCSRTEQLKDYLPAANFTAHYFQLVVPPRVAELTRRFEAAAAQNREALMEIVKKAAPGEPLPYDPIFGISREEYAELLALGKRSALQEVVAAPVVVTKNPEGGLKYDLGAVWEGFGQFVFYPEKNAIDTPYGRIENPKFVQDEGSGSPLGKHSGFTFQMERGSMDGPIDSITALTLRVSFFRASDGSFRCLYVRLHEFKDGKQVQAKEVIAKYEIHNAQ